MKEATITEFHCCCDCKKSIDIPGKEHDSFETGCLDKRGKPNRSGGLCRCGYFIRRG